MGICRHVCAALPEAIYYRDVIKHVTMTSQKCKTCGMVFPNEERLARHRAKAHQDKPKYERRGKRGPHSIDVDESQFWG